MRTNCPPVGEWKDFLLQPSGKLKIKVTPVTAKTRKLRSKWKVDIDPNSEYNDWMELGNNVICFHCDEEIEMLHGTEFFSISRHVNRIKLGKEVINFHPECLKKIAGKRFMSSLSQTKVVCKVCETLYDPINEKQVICTKCTATELRKHEKFLAVGKCSDCGTQLGNPYYSSGKRNFCKPCAEKSLFI